MRILNQSIDKINESINLISQLKYMDKTKQEYVTQMLIASVDLLEREFTTRNQQPVDYEKERYNARQQRIKEDIQVWINDREDLLSD